MNVTFSSSIPSDISSKYLSPESRKNTVGILGSSKSTDEITDYMTACADITKGIILSGKNIVHGCGNQGIMGTAYDAGKTYSKKDKDGKPEQNLAIIANPLWGDEDLDNCIPLTSTNSEAERIEKFAQVANSFVIFPGSSTTLQEAATLITKNYYGKSEDKKQIILVGKDFFKGLQEQYQKLYDCKLIKCPPEELFTIVDNEEEINDIIK
ncbi:MAG: LOG family protein [Candidatus Gastranaerophilales bacterium]|nr:LOG family protein [Candidatus Gastranaerophilales bacterium]